MDQFSIEPGEDFGFTIQQAVTHARVVLALIGPQWHTMLEERGRHRSIIERDFVRRELTAAFDRGTRVIPVLLPNADVSVLSRVHLEGRSLGAVQAISVTARHWSVVTDELIRIIRPMLGPSGGAGRSGKGKRSGKPRRKRRA
jgi:hypothetical protein